MTGRRARPRQPRDGAVAAVLGAMLLAGILVTGLVVYQVTVVPTLDAASEAEHMQKVSQQLAALKGEVDRQLENRTHAPTAHPVSLGAQETSAISQTGASGSLAFQPGDKPVSVWSKRLLVQEVNGTRVGSVTEDWLPADGSGVEGIVSVHSFRLRVDEISRTHDGDSLTVWVTDADGEHAGLFKVSVDDPVGPDYHVVLHVEDADGAVLYDEPKPYAHNTELSPYWIDLLNPNYRFDRVLGAAEKPLDISLTEDGLTGDYAISYEKKTPGGGTQLVSGGGVVHQDYNRSFQGGTLLYASTNENFERQELLLETGALVLSQHQGALFKVRPHVRAALVDNIVQLTLSLPTLDGETSSVTGGGTGTVYVSTSSQYWITGRASNLTVEVASDHPDLWADRWSTQLEAAGLSQGTSFDVTTTADAATLEVWGLLNPDPASEEYDLFVTLRQATIQVELEG